MHPVAAWRGQGAPNTRHRRFVHPTCRLKSASKSVSRTNFLALSPNLTPLVSNMKPTNKAQDDDAVFALSTEVNHKLDLHQSSAEALRLAGVYTRQSCVLDLYHGYRSDDEDTEPDEEDGRLQTVREYHENGMLKLMRTFVRRLRRDATDPTAESSYYDRVVEEKHYDPSGICRVDMHFALGQPYLYRKHYYPNNRLKSEKVFFVEDEETMRARKVGHWRTYYENGNIQSEIIYNKDGVRCGFCKRYAIDGAIEWVKDYTREQEERLQAFNAKRGNLDLTVTDAARVLGLEGDWCSHVVNRTFRSKCAPLHPDWRRTAGDKAGETWEEEQRTEAFIRLSRAREVLLKFLETHPRECSCERGGA